MVTTAEELGRRPWRSDPDRYIRQRKGKYQARPYNLFTRERENLGLFHTRAQAQKAIERYWRGELKPRPKFVRQTDTPRGVRYFVMIPTAGPNQSRAWLRLDGRFDTAEAAVAARDAFLEATFGRLVAAAMLSRKDTSRRAGRY